MIIAINFDNTLTDTNYSVIDYLNTIKKEKISYDDFESEDITDILNHSKVTDKERRNMRMYSDELLKEIDICVMAEKFIEERVSKGDKIYLISSRKEEDREQIIRWLKSKRVSINSKNIILGLDSREKIKECMKLGVDFLIEDDPEVISYGVKYGIQMVVKTNHYNRNYINILRLDCWSQLGDVVKKVELKKKKQMRRESRV